MRASSATRSSSSRRRTPLALFRPAAVDREVHVGISSDLRQVRDDDDLMGAGQPGQPPPDLYRGAPADAGVDLVEDHRRARSGRGQHNLEREHDPRQLAARCALAQRQHVGGAVRGEAELNRVDTIVAGVNGLTGRQCDRGGVVGPRLQWGDGNGEFGVDNRQTRQFGGHRFRRVPWRTWCAPW